MKIQNQQVPNATRSKTDKLQPDWNIGLRSKSRCGSFKSALSGRALACTLRLSVLGRKGVGRHLRKCV